MSIFSKQNEYQDQTNISLKDEPKQLRVKSSQHSFEPFCYFSLLNPDRLTLANEILAKVYHRT